MFDTVDRDTLNRVMAERDQARQRVLALVGRVANLEAALLPFVNDTWIPLVGLARVTYADWRKARAVLENTNAGD